MRHAFQLYRAVGLLALLLLVCTTARAQTTPIPPTIDALMIKYTCKACHRPDTRIVGPPLVEVAKTKHYTPAQIVALIYKPVPTHWPDYPPMAPVSYIPKADALKLAKWIAGLGGPAAPKTGAKRAKKG